MFRGSRFAWVFGFLGWVHALPVQAAELVMFEREGCVWCQRWEREIGSVYPRTPEGRRAPLRHVSLDRPVPAEFRLDPPIRYTPTFVLMENGREIGRITGYIGDDAFWGLLAKMMIRLDDLEPAAAD